MNDVKTKALIIQVDTRAFQFLIPIEKVKHEQLKTHQQQRTYNKN